MMMMMVMVMAQSSAGRSVVGGMWTRAKSRAYGLAEVNYKISRWPLQVLMVRYRLHLRIPAGLHDLNWTGYQT